MRSLCTRTTLAAVTAVAVGAATAGLVTNKADAAVSGCSVSYAVPSQWNTGFTASVTITNLGDPLTSWSLGCNVTFTSTAWTTDISHGEMLRNGYDQTLTISGCNMRYVYQGRDPSVSTGSYSTLPWRLALLTQTNSTC